MTIAIEPIGYVRGGRSEATKDHWGLNRCSLTLRSERFTSAALDGLEEVSHIEVIFYFHLHDDEAPELAARHPRDRDDWPRVGIFAQHGRMRPNRIGASICELLKVQGTTVDVAGLDAVDGTPILDIKPVWSGYLPRGPLREPQWAKEIMAKYW
jgi:tRNA-Thr(GGU) m(6)t(6)A37 methyltransferase TsaA